MKRKTSRRRIRRLGLALAVVAIAAPAAQAAPQVQYPDDLHATVPHVSAPSVTYPDDLTRPYVIEQQSKDLVQPTSNVGSDSSGLEWMYVGIGFIALGLLLLGGGALFISRQNRRGRLAAA